MLFSSNKNSVNGQPRHTVFRSSLYSHSNGNYTTTFGEKRVRYSTLNGQRKTGKYARSKASDDETRNISKFRNISKLRNIISLSATGMGVIIINIGKMLQHR